MQKEKGKLKIKKFKKKILKRIYEREKINLKTKEKDTQ